LTQTLDWSAVLGESSSARRHVVDRTSDLTTIFGERSEARAELASVRNVVIVSRGEWAHRSQSRAALDLLRRAVIDFDPSAGAGALDWERLAHRITEWTRATSSWRYGLESRGGVDWGELGGSSAASTDVAAATDAAERVARRAFPDASLFEWSDVTDDEGVSYKLLRVVSPASSERLHESYLAFIRAWVGEEAPERRSRIRLAYRAASSG
jgi:hypothetical protein